MKRETLLDKLKKLNKTPLHMPGHKRNLALFEKYEASIPFDIDITEIHNYDDLHNSDGILKESMDEASKIWGVDKSYFLVNGSTGGILSAIYAANGRNSKIIVARNCHKSVYHAIEIFNLKTVFVMPEIDFETGILSRVSPESIEDEILKNMDAKSVIITSPTYEGIISDVSEISKVCHRYGKILIVDEAHGAHLSLSKYFTGGAVESDADVVVQSLHKTLPSLTQTAILHTKGRMIDQKKLQKGLQMFQTSSPSYVLMSSIDLCLEMIKNKEYFENWHKILKDFYAITANLTNIKILFTEDNLFDKSKIVIYLKNTILSGNILSRILRDKYSIELEMESINYCIAMTGMGDDIKSIEKLSSALLEIDKLNIARESIDNISYYNMPKKSISINEALESERIYVDYDNAKGEICAEYIWAYPPGIPLVVPGEVLDDNIINNMKLYADSGIELVHSFSTDVKKISICIDKK
ncbi:MAG: aminotransferase class I/II-fold pyridoxal phosphate-dependent enzyme [Tissierellia bacterium]|nr:aminotransferase class I/II-fold pyridoxal phosphate-dependent enzyme [Tissierellia bacterium]